MASSNKTLFIRTGSEKDSKPHLLCMLLLKIWIRNKTLNNFIPLKVRY